ncbi:hypothetical protein H0G86_000862 [Trichoderma simmonsii]|uniref:Uncharacterized protein n=1 Tax=Trichoderma simmonsii TaxID=1491479 RepID=A0A8G0L0G9_9HYPO|nr:hypothetical protein H0G86_000862 [Trichoderma simmonsii]
MDHHKAASFGPSELKAMGLKIPRQGEALEPCLHGEEALVLLMRADIKLLVLHTQVRFTVINVESISACETVVARVVTCISWSSGSGSISLSLGRHTSAKMRHLYFVLNELDLDRMLLRDRSNSLVQRETPKSIGRLLQVLMMANPAASTRVDLMS